MILKNMKNIFNEETAGATIFVIVCIAVMCFCFYRSIENDKAREAYFSTHECHKLESGDVYCQSIEDLSETTE